MGAMIVGNNIQSVVGIIVRLIPAMQGKLSKLAVASSRVFFKKTVLIGRSQGLPGLVKYLKMASVILQQAISGHKIPSTSPRVSRTNKGLPRIIPSGIRKNILRGQTFWMRFSMTLCSIYRDIEYPGQLKLSTISAPFGGKSSAIAKVSQYIERFTSLFVEQPTGTTGLELMKGHSKVFPISTSSPQAFSLKVKGDKIRFASTHPISLVRSALALTPEQVGYIETLAALPMAPGERSQVIELLHTIRGAGPTKGGMRPTGPFKPAFGGITGKLALKDEPAGKIRVFAMVDPFTHWTLYPFHAAIFSILRYHTQMDGTFDQLAPIHGAWKLWSKGHKFPMFSMDLSAATDRLPALLQEMLIEKVFHLSADQAFAWRDLLVGRTYMLPMVGNFHYSVGQPMGAYSSWAMLALTHHFIVQASAWSSGVCDAQSLFKDYAVLGDDIVIFNAKVAKAYHQLITDLGVECNPNKSIMSPKGLGMEFAKKTFFKGVEISPTPIKELYAALSSVTGLAEYGRKYNLSLPQILTAAGFGYKVKGACHNPLFSQNLKVKFLVLTMMAKEPSTFLASLSAMIRGKVSNSLFETSVATFTFNYILKQQRRIESLLERLAPLAHTTTDEKLVVEWMGNTLFSDIAKYLGKYGVLTHPVRMQMMKVQTLYSTVYGSSISNTYEAITKFKYLVTSHTLPTITNLAGATHALHAVLDAVMEIFTFYDEETIIAQGASADEFLQTPKLFRLEQEWMKVLVAMRKGGLLKTPLLVKGEGFVMIGYIQP